MAKYKVKETLQLPGWWDGAQFQSPGSFVEIDEEKIHVREDSPSLERVKEAKKGKGEE